jgi:hypothetical protein
MVCKAAAVMRILHCVDDEMHAARRELDLHPPGMRSRGGGHSRVCLISAMNAAKLSLYFSPIPPRPASPVAAASSVCVCGQSFRFQIRAGQPKPGGGLRCASRLLITPPQRNDHHQLQWRKRMRHAKDNAPATKPRLQATDIADSLSGPFRFDDCANICGFAARCTNAPLKTLYEY